MTLLRHTYPWGAKKGHGSPRTSLAFVSAVKNGRVGNSVWGWSMHGKRGGRAMADKHLELLREMAPLA